MALSGHEGLLQLMSHDPRLHLRAPAIKHRAGVMAALELSAASGVTLGGSREVQNW